MKKLMLAAVFGLLALVVVAVLGVNAYLNWLDRPGCLSRRNYERIQTGMTLPEVEALLGGPGEELRPEDVPKYVDSTEPGAEERPKPLVTGDQFFRWLGQPGNIIGKQLIIGLRGGQVCDKYYWEPSL